MGVASTIVRKVIGEVGDKLGRASAKLLLAISKRAGVKTGTAAFAEANQQVVKAGVEEAVQKAAMNVAKETGEKIATKVAKAGLKVGEKLAAMTTKLAVLGVAGGAVYM